MASAKALLGAVAGRFLFRHGDVGSVSRLSEHFVRIDVSGAELARAPFTPGDKVQVFFDGIGMRTYTPVTWSSEGSAWFVGFAHGNGPGSNWVRTVKAGDPIAMFGPGRSIDVDDVKGPLVVIGDETSLAVAASLTRAKPGRVVTTLLEAGSVDEVKDVARALELTHTTVLSRGDVEGLSKNLTAQLELGATPVFTGNALTIQSLKKFRRDAGGKTKAYWAAGKRGLD